MSHREKITPWFQTKLVTLTSYLQNVHLCSQNELRNLLECWWVGKWMKGGREGGTDGWTGGCMTQCEPILL